MKKRIVVIFMLSILFISGCGNRIENGRDLLKEGKYKEAMIQFESAIEKNKDTAEAYRGMGIAYYEQNNYKNAKESFLQALELGAKETPILYNLIGICMMKEEAYTEALSYYEKGIALLQKGESVNLEENEVFQEMLYNQIVCYEKLKDWEQAKLKVAEYVKLFPEDKAAQKEAQFLETR